jgi:hypothetical protein
MSMPIGCQRERERKKKGGRLVKGHQLLYRFHSRLSFSWSPRVCWRACCTPRRYATAVQLTFNTKNSHLVHLNGPAPDANTAPTLSSAPLTWTAEVTYLGVPGRRCTQGGTSTLLVSGQSVTNKPGSSPEARPVPLPQAATRGVPSLGVPVPSGRSLQPRCAGSTCPTAFFLCDGLAATA